MKHTVHIVNGPNLNLLGQREPDKYGHTSFEAYFESLRAAFPEVQLSYFQSNVEGELIDHLHAIGFERWRHRIECRGVYPYFSGVARCCGVD